MAWAATDDFSSYTIGTSLSGLNGGSGWTSAYQFVGGTVNVQSSPAGITPTQCARSTASSGRATRNFTGVTLGTGSFSIRSSTTSITANQVSAIRIENQAGSIVFYVGFDSTTGNLVASNGGATIYATLITTFAANTWYVIDFDIDTTNQANKIRFRVNSGSWSAWVTGVTTFTSINGITLNDDNANAHNFYWADIRAAVTNINYTLTASQGSYSFTGEASNNTSARRISLTQGAYSLSGQATTFQKALRMLVTTGSYALTGIVTTLSKAKNYVLTVTTGLFTLTGKDSSLVLFIQNAVTRLTRWLALRKIK